MSAFLGPIHYWLYRKIELQQSIVEDIYSLGQQYGLSLQEECNEKYGVLESGTLEEIIDVGNIHGWLQERVSQVEAKYAYVVTSLIKKDPNSLDQLKSVLSNNGKERGLLSKDANYSVAGLYKEINDNLLDGMPCDHANSLVNETESDLIWKRNVCVHKQYWDALGGDIAIYYELRDAWMNGFVQECGFEIDKLDSITYCLKKGDCHE